jgi:hypothetical protein
MTVNVTIGDGPLLATMANKVEEYSPVFIDLRDWREAR